MPDVHNCGNYTCGGGGRRVYENSTSVHVFCKFKTLIKIQLTKKQD